MNIRHNRHIHLINSLCWRQRGTSYIEVMVATVLIATMLVPAMEALSPAIQGSGLHKKKAEIHYLLQGKMEQVLAEPFNTLDEAATDAGSHNTKTSYSDTAAPIPYRVYIWRYDVDNADLDNKEMTGGEADVLWVKVQLKDRTRAIETLISPY